MLGGCVRGVLVVRNGAKVCREVLCEFQRLFLTAQSGERLDWVVVVVAVLLDMFLVVLWPPTARLTGLSDRKAGPQKETNMVCS